MENALYNDPRVQEAAAVGVPDERLGELVAAVVSIKPAYQGYVTEAALIATARQRYTQMSLKPICTEAHSCFAVFLGSQYL